VVELLKIYPDVKRVPSSMVIRIAAIRHVETVMMLERKSK
jgi:hypothetical protein